MNTPNTPKKNRSNTSAVTILITAASIAAAMTGWAVFANKDSGADSSAVAVVAEVAPVENTVAPSATLKPLPTIVPLVGTTPQATKPTSVAQVQPKVAVPTPQAQAPTIQQPAVRNVNPAPRPVTRSRSSR